jgi:fluoroquinolone transport system permease protein
VIRPAALLRTDARRLRRDPLLLLLACVPPALVLAVRGGWGVAESAGAGGLPGWGAAVAMVVLLLLTPMMFGFITGLMLLDERDEGVLQAIALTPPGTAGVLRWRLLWPAVWSGGVAVFALLVLGGLGGLGGVGGVGPARLGAVAVLVALQTPLLALFLGVFAPDKVTGMALAKVGSTLIGAGAAAALLPAPWRWAAAWSPHFWLVEVLGGGGPVAIAAAVGVHVAALLLLGRTFAARRG